jgi:hypothetical protein
MGSTSDDPEIQNAAILFTIDRSAKRGEEGGMLMLILMVLCLRDEFSLSIEKKTNKRASHLFPSILF